MSRSSDVGHFFQTSASLADAERKEAKKSNANGQPVRLPSKLLAVNPDPNDDGCVFVAEAAGTVKLVDVDNGEIKRIFRPSTSTLAPLTCLAVEGQKLYAGSWDKTIYGWDLANDSGAKEIKNSQSFSAGHSDFVKAVLATKVGSSSLLVSASADATLVIWNATTGAKLHTLKGHARGVLALALESVSTDHATIFSGDSSREIRRWYISPSSCYEIPVSSDIAPTGPIDPLIAHETSIFALALDADGDLWTASADKTSKCLSRSEQWKADTTLTHPDFVKGVAVHENLGLVVTACRDENVRIWERGSGKLVYVYDGHYEEVTGIVVVKDRAVSVSIDGTIRAWGLTASDIKRAKEEAEKVKEEKIAEKNGESMLTAEEEAELAELMDDDD